MRRKFRGEKMVKIDRIAHILCGLKSSLNFFSPWANIELSISSWKPSWNFRKSNKFSEINPITANLITSSIRENSREILSFHLLKIRIELFHHERTWKNRWNKAFLTESFLFFWTIILFNAFLLFTFLLDGGKKCSLTSLFHNSLTLPGVYLCCFLLLSSLFPLSWTFRVLFSFTATFLCWWW
jgi:hypothetical protein